MQENQTHNGALTAHRMIQLALLAGLFLLCYKIVAFFVSPVLWAAILVYITRPLSERLDSFFPNRRLLVALIMTLGLTLIIALPLIVSSFALQKELFILLPQIQQQLATGHLALPEFVVHIPWIGPQLQDIVMQANANPDDTTDSLMGWLHGNLHYGREIMSKLSLNAARLTFAVITAFFFYLDGDVLLKQIKRAMHLIVGGRIDNYFEAISKTTRAVVYGIGLTALAQAALAGIAYYIVSYFVPNLPSPLLLTVITLVLALIPMATPLAWGGVCLWLFLNNYPIPAICLGVWGIIVVSWIDNFIRPMVISSATKIPFLLIIFGVLGGIAKFGMIGLFVGPVILAIFLAVWREWLATESLYDHQRSRTNYMALDDTDK